MSINQQFTNKQAIISLILSNDIIFPNDMEAFKVQSGGLQVKTLLWEMKWAQPFPFWCIKCLSNRVFHSHPVQVQIQLINYLKLSSLSKVSFINHNKKIFIVNNVILVLERYQNLNDWSVGVLRPFCGGGGGTTNILQTIRQEVEGKWWAETKRHHLTGDILRIVITHKKNWIHFVNAPTTIHLLRSYYDPTALRLMSCQSQSSCSWVVIASYKFYDRIVRMHVL